MAQIGLFGKEAESLVKETKKGRRREKSKEKTICDLSYERGTKYSDIEETKGRIVLLQAQDETGWDELKKSISGKDVNIKLCEAHISYYEKEIAEITKKLKEARAVFNPLLNEWKNFIIKYCQEKGKEIPEIWFETSSPYDCQVSVRMKGHKCYWDCVSFRFRDSKLEAYDSNFGGGTTFVEHYIHQNHMDIQNEIMKVMDKVFMEECSKSRWNDDVSEVKTHEIDDEGWLVSKW